MRTAALWHSFSRQKHILLLLFSLFVCFAVIPQSGLAQQRKPFIPRTIDWAYRIVQGDSAKPYKKYYFAIPIVAYKPESKWILGVSLAYIFRPKKEGEATRPSLIRTNISYSQQRQFSIRPMIDIFTRDNKFYIRGQYQYTNFAEYYWGLGINVPASGKELYHFRMHKAQLKGSYLLGRHLYAGLQGSFEQMFHVAYEPGSKLEVSGIQGASGYSASGAGFTVSYDDRDNVYFPFRGSMIELSNVFYHDIFGSNYNFTNFTLDMRHYRQLWRENVLAFQGYLTVNEGNIPFRMQGVLGSDMFMRGYYNGRYRDNHAMAVQAEFRKTIWGPVGCAVFAGFGTVSPNGGGLITHLKPSIGLGLRVKAIPRERVNIRMDYGFGVDGNQALYVTLHEAF